MTNKKVAEEFARGSSKGKSLHMFIDGSVVFSYGRHFPIARFTNERRTHALFTTKGYSVTTARHKNLVKAALIDRGVEITMSSEVA